MSSLFRQLRRHARLQPDSIAIMSGNDQMSYAALMSAVDDHARQLQQIEVRNLGVYLDNGIDWIVVDLACLSMGIGVVPLPSFFSEIQLRHASRDGCIDHIVFSNSLPAGIAGSGIARNLSPACKIQKIRATITVAPEYCKRTYTSGTTGHPKGVELDASFISQTCEALCERLGELQFGRHLSLLPYATLLENIAGIYVPLMLGKTVCAEPAASIGMTDDLRIEPSIVLQCFNRVRPQSLILTPQLLEIFCVLAENGALDPRCLDFVAVGGASLGVSLLHRARNAGIPAFEGYGLTEFGSVAILNTPDCDRPGSVGKPLPGVEVSLSEEDEVCLTTTVVDPAQTDGSLQVVSVMTGDIGEIDADGFVAIKGRKANRFVLSNGRNVAPEWLETELNGSTLIQQSYVYCEADLHICALVFAHPEASDTAVEVELKRINSRLPAYAKIVSCHRMPVPLDRDQGLLTINGRLKRPSIYRVLPQLLATARCLKRALPAISFKNLKQEKIPC